MYNSSSGASRQHLPAGNAAVKAIRSARPDRDDSQGGVEGGGALEKERTPSHVPSSIFLLDISTSQAEKQKEKIRK
jgi:hypothetical protein